MRVVERDSHAIEPHATHRGNRMRHVTIHAVRQFGDSANAPALRTRRVLIAKHQALNGNLRLVIELVAVAMDKFDAVVLERIV